VASKAVAKIVHCGLPRLHTALVGAYAPMLPDSEGLADFRAFLATAGRNWAPLWLASRKSCEDCPVWVQTNQLAQQI